MERKKKAETISQIKQLADLSENHQKLLEDIRFKMNGIELEEFAQVALDKAVKLLEGVDNE